MLKSKFDEFWTASVSKWTSGSFVYNKKSYVISNCCKIKKGASDIVFEKYNKIKTAVKDCYFNDNSSNCHLSRYKRAACLIYAILLADPLICRSKYLCEGVKSDILFLKQRLAFSLGLNSILQDYPQSSVQNYIDKNGKLFDFSSIAPECEQSDDFLLSIYKDLFFSEIFKNYNVLNMANMLWLLTQKASGLGSIEPLE